MPDGREVMLLALRYLRAVRMGDACCESGVRAKRLLRLRREENVAGSREVRELDLRSKWLLDEGDDFWGI